MQGQPQHALIKTKLTEGGTHLPIPNARVRFFASSRNADSQNGPHNCEPKVMGQWHQVAVDSTDESGCTSKHPGKLEAGQYRVRFVLPEYHQIQKGSIRINYVDAEIFVFGPEPIEIHMQIFPDGYRFVLQ